MFGAGNDALVWELMALQAVDDALVIADVRGRKRCPGVGAYGPSGRRPLVQDVVKWCRYIAILLWLNRPAFFAGGGYFFY